MPVQCIAAISIVAKISVSRAGNYLVIRINVVNFHSYLLLESQLSGVITDMNR